MLIFLSVYYNRNYPQLDNSPSVNYKLTDNEKGRFCFCFILRFKDKKGDRAIVSSLNYIILWIDRYDDGLRINCRLFIAVACDGF